MPMALVGLAIKLALITGTPVFPFVRFVALRFLSVPLAIWIVCANELLDFGAAWNDAFVSFLNVAFASETEAGAGEQYDTGGKGGGSCLKAPMVKGGTPSGETGLLPVH